MECPQDRLLRNRENITLLNKFYAPKTVDVILTRLIKLSYICTQKKHKRDGEVRVTAHPSSKK